MLTSRQKWRRTLRWLRANFQLRCPCLVRKRKMQDEGVCCEYEKPTRIIIGINSESGFSMQIDTLLHEWAHARTMNGNDTDDHGEEWSLQYGKIYSSFVLWNYGEEQ